MDFYIECLALHNEFVRVVAEHVKSTIDLQVA